ncbi:MutS protein msh4 [Microbotryomycetes sp. JL201]|nr:MutS protein msh4 [Microbotryomycetes sp. JL201]
MSSFRSRPPTRTSSSVATFRPSSVRPGTSASTSVGPPEDQPWIVSMLESKGVGREIGLAAIHVEFGQVVVAQYDDSSNYVKTIQFCQTHKPSQIILPQSALTTAPAPLRHQKSANVVFRAESQASHRDGEQMAPTGLFQALTQHMRASLINATVRKEWDEQASLRVWLLTRTRLTSPSVLEDWSVWTYRFSNLELSTELSWAGYEYLTKLMVRDDRRTGTILAVRSKYYALAAASALFKHVERSMALQSASLSISFKPALGSCLIDIESVRNLELVSNLLNKHSKQHLFGMLNFCYTPMATRLLRSLILSPPTEGVLVDERLDVVEELVNSEQRLLAIRKALEPLKSMDCDKLVGQIILPTAAVGVKVNAKTDPAKDAETKITRLLSLRTLLTSLPGLRSALHGSDSRLLKDVSKALCEPKVDAILEAIADTLNEDAVNVQQKGAALARNRRIYAVKAEKKLLLDVARETYKEGVSDAYNFCENLKNEHQLESMNLVASGSGNLSQFVFQCSKAEIEERNEGLPKTFINVIRKGKNIEFSCPDLVKQNARIKDSIEEIFILRSASSDSNARSVPAEESFCSNAILEQVLVGIRAEIASSLTQLPCTILCDPNGPTHSRSKLDVTRYKSVFSMQMAPLYPSKSDTYANDASNFQIITGANMSGKTTYLKQIALLQIMAQIGSFVPAEYASFRLVDTLLTRLGNDDSIEASLSTFAQEMSTMAMILGALETSERSLIIVDELGRGTSPEEGVGLAHAIAEELIHAKAFCFFASHFKASSVKVGQVDNHSNTFHCAGPLHNIVEISERGQPTFVGGGEVMPTTRNNFAIEYRHRVLDGATPLTHYGLELAKLAALPTDVLDRATEVSAKLADLAAQANSRSESGKDNTRRRELLQLRAALKNLYDSPAGAMTAQQMLSKAAALQDHIIDVLNETAPELEGEDESDEAVGEQGDIRSEGPRG